MTSSSILLALAVSLVGLNDHAGVGADPLDGQSTEIQVAQRGAVQAKEPAANVEEVPGEFEEKKADGDEEIAEEEGAETESDDDHETEVEELVDFEEEERASDEEAQRMIAAAGGGSIGGMGGGTGIKLFVDLLLNYQAGQKSFDFRPNHTYVLVQADIMDRVQFLIHVSDDPILFELTLNLTETLDIAMGKMLLPFGINQFHHIIGGRVDQQSHFLPETWGDYGLALKHRVWDGEWIAAEYSAYVVNGFAGTDGPVIADGTAADNNFAKGLGGQLAITAFRSVILTGSGYYDIWDDENEHQMVYYAVGMELLPGLYRKIPVLNRMRFRGEWARGEIEMAERNYQQGLIEHAFARAGYFGEMTARIWGPVVGRIRVGKINPDNTVTDRDDVEVYEPAILIGTGKKVWWTLGYQFTTGPGFNYGFDSPPDVAYGKVFVMY
jgi:hypothetical protein